MELSTQAFMTISGIHRRRKKDTQIWGWNENTVAEMTEEATAKECQQLPEIKETKGKKPPQATQPAIFYNICYSDINF